MSVTTFPNLARRNPSEDEINRVTEMVRIELLAAGVEVVPPDEKYHGEVPTRVEGRVGPFVFQRLWYYYSVSGNFPAQRAQQMYDSNEDWRRAVRANGDAARKSPMEHASWYLLDGRQVYPLSEKVKFEKIIEASEIMARRLRDEMKLIVFHDDPRSLLAMPFVPGFHVDDAYGLRMLVDQIQEALLMGQVLMPTKPSTVEKLADPVECPRPGDLMYVDTSLFIDHGEDDRQGGLAVVEDVELQGRHRMVSFVNCPGHSFNLDFLMAKQRKLHEQYGLAWAHPDPDCAKGLVPTLERLRDDILHRWAKPDPRKFFHPVRAMLPEVVS